jgi:dipeptidyl-peptidase-4
MRVLAVEASSGNVRTIVQESVESFFDYSNKTYLEFLDGGKELLWMSERSGWNHLYLIDTVHGAVKNPVTRGEWVVRGVDKLDAEQRRIWVRVSGIWPRSRTHTTYASRPGEPRRHRIRRADRGRRHP